MGNKFDESHKLEVSDSRQTLKTTQSVSEIQDQTRPTYGEGSQNASCLWWGGDRGLTGKGDKRTFWGDGNIPYLVWGGNFIGVPLVIIGGTELICAFYHVCIITELLFLCQFKKKEEKSPEAALLCAMCLPSPTGVADLQATPGAPQTCSPPSDKSSYPDPPALSP